MTKVTISTTVTSRSFPLGSSVVEPDHFNNPDTTYHFETAPNHTVESLKAGTHFMTGWSNLEEVKKIIYKNKYGNSSDPNPDAFLKGDFLVWIRQNDTDPDP